MATAAPALDLSTLATADLEMLLAARHADTAAAKAVEDAKFVATYVTPIAEQVLARNVIVHAKTSTWIGASESFPHTDALGRVFNIKVTATAVSDSAKALAGPKPAPAPKKA